VGGVRSRWEVFGLLGAAVVVASCGPKAPQVAKVTEEPPLLLDDGNAAEAARPPEGPVADNNRCYVCHMNYQEEKLTIAHARANIGCERCHGPSNAHCSDEDNITPPDIMYPAGKIKAFCMTCHPKDKIDIKPHEPLFTATGPSKKVCTDCHGQHRLAHRTRRWDKETRKLIEDDNVRMIRRQKPKS
jgi:hypothetical protein